MNVTVFGTGRMGAPIARRLLGAGFPVRVWNRTAEKARALEPAGAVVASSPADAVAGADVIITMLADGPATADAVTGAFDGIGEGALWVQMGTIGLEWTQRLAAQASEHGVTFIDAPVSGSDVPARDGKLVILAAPGDGERGADVRPKLQRIFDAVGRRTVWLGAVGEGTALKLVLNAWLASITEAAAEGVVFAEALGLDPSVFIDTLADLPLGAPYATMKAKAMVERHFEPGFALRHAEKDVGLAATAADSLDLSLPMLSAIHDRWEQAVADGHGDQDVAVVVETSRSVPAAAPPLANAS